VHVLRNLVARTYIVHKDPSHTRGQIVESLAIQIDSGRIILVPMRVFGMFKSDGGWTQGALSRMGRIGDGRAERVPGEGRRPALLTRGSVDFKQERRVQPGCMDLGAAEDERTSDRGVGSFVHSLIEQGGMSLAVVVTLVFVGESTSDRPDH
jgi:hypothetical protein